MVKLSPGKRKLIPPAQANRQQGQTIAIHQHFKYMGVAESPCKEKRTQY
jgi:hypothetical protein